MSDELGGAIEAAIKVAETAGQVAEQAAERVASGVKNAELGAEGARGLDELDNRAGELGLGAGEAPDAAVLPQMQQNDAWPGTSPDLSTMNTGGTPDAMSRPSSDQADPDGTGASRADAPENPGSGGDQAARDQR
jgi:hypothetical protein